METQEASQLHKQSSCQAKKKSSRNFEIFLWTKPWFWPKNNYQLGKTTQLEIPCHDGRFEIHHDSMVVGTQSRTWEQRGEGWGAYLTPEWKKKRRESREEPSGCRTGESPPLPVGAQAPPWPMIHIARGGPAVPSAVVCGRSLKSNHTEHRCSRSTMTALLDRGPRERRNA